MTSVYKLLQNIIDWIKQNIDYIGNAFIALMTIIVVYICSKYSNTYREGALGSIDIDSGNDPQNGDIGSSIDDLDELSKKNINYVIETDKRTTNVLIDDINKISLSQQDEKVDHRNLDNIISLFRTLIYLKDA